MFGFLQKALTVGSCSQVLYLSGMPGAGKTASVHEVVGALRRRGSNCPLFKFVQVNAMRHNNPSAVFVEIWRCIFNKQVKRHAEACAALNQYFASNDVSREPIILFLDEVDGLLAHAQVVLYRVLDWLSHPNARLAIVAVANTIDLPERLLPRVASRLNVVRINFPPYTRAQLQAIVHDRLCRGGVGGIFSQDALGLCAARVAACSGDARKLLQVCNRAVQCLQEELGEGEVEHYACKKTDKELIGTAHIIQAETMLLRSNPATSAIQRLGLKAQRLLLAIIIELRQHEESPPMLHSVVRRYERLMSLYEQREATQRGEAAPCQLHSRHNEDAHFTVQRLEAMSIIKLHAANNLNSALVTLGQSLDEEGVINMLTAQEDGQELARELQDKGSRLFAP